MTIHALSYILCICAQWQNTMHHFTMAREAIEDTIRSTLLYTIVSFLVDRLRYTEMVSLLPAFRLIVSIISCWMDDQPRPTLRGHLSRHVERIRQFWSAWMENALRFWTEDPLSRSIDEQRKRVSDPIFHHFKRYSNTRDFDIRIVIVISLSFNFLFLSWIIQTSSSWNFFKWQITICMQPLLKRFKKGK